MQVREKKKERKEAKNNKIITKRSNHKPKEKERKEHMYCHQRNRKTTKLLNLRNRNLLHNRQHRHHTDNNRNIIHLTTNKHPPIHSRRSRKGA